MRHQRTLILNTVLLLGFILTSVSVTPAQPSAASITRSSAEQKTARHFESIRKSPPNQWAFLLQMPKGADLHSHLSGAVYAESYIQWAADGGLCVNTKTLALSKPPQPNQCDPKLDQTPANVALKNRGLRQQMIEAWSMLNWKPSAESGHDHFFNAFVKFGPATWGQTGKMLAEVVARAARGKVLYLELMLTPDGGVSSEIGDKVGWDGNFESTLNKLKANRIDTAVAAAIKNISDAEDEKDRLLKCRTTRAHPGCSVKVRYIAQVGRTAQLGPVYAQMVTGFMLANDPNSKVVALNLVQPEDAPNALNNFSDQMQMLKFLRKGSRAHVTLHAGELVPGLATVTAKDLAFHIRDSVMIAGAERIGHGVDIMHENNPDELLKEMARRDVLVEICLSSNDLILGVSGAEHPLATYIKDGVPVALATDDEGVARSEISREYLKAAQDQGLGYLQLKTMARHSLQYAFASGGSLWSDGRKFTPVAQCRQDIIVMKLTSSGCKQFVESSEKAKLQWKLEEQFRDFERKW